MSPNFKYKRGFGLYTQELIRYLKITKLVHLTLKRPPVNIKALTEQSEFNIGNGNRLNFYEVRIKTGFQSFFTGSLFSDYPSDGSKDSVGFIFEPKKPELFWFLLNRSEFFLQA